jgi:hypothetical protein
MTPKQLVAEALGPLFSLYQPNAQQFQMYVEVLSDCEAAALRRAGERLAHTWDRVRMPPVGAIRREYVDIRNEDAQRAQQQERKAQHAGHRGYTEPERRLMGIVRDLYRRRCCWWFERECWIAPSDDEYGKAWTQELNPPDKPLRRGPLLDETVRMWKRVAPGEPEPRPIGASVEAVEASLTNRVTLRFRPDQAARE